MIKYIFFSVVIAGLLPGQASSADDAEYLQFIEDNGSIVLETYRTPEGSDLSYWGTDREQDFNKTLDSDFDQKAPYWTKGFFNADKLPDYLYIVFHRTHDKAYLIGFISHEKDYRIVAIGPSSKRMAVETKRNNARHYHLEGQGHMLSWDEQGKNFKPVQ